MDGRDVIDLEKAQPDAAQPDAAADEGAVQSSSAFSQDELNRVTADIVAALKSVYDPEIPVDIYELGLIYNVDYSDERDVKIIMTLTAPGCPVAGEMPGWIQDAVAQVEGVRTVDVELTFDPPWSPARMSDEAKLELNMI